MPEHWKGYRHAWAIHNLKSGGLKGVFYFTNKSLEPWHDGCRTALFRTRSQARTAAKGSYYPARVVKVIMKYEEVK